MVLTWWGIGVWGSVCYVGMMWIDLCFGCGWCDDGVGTWIGQIIVGRCDLVVLSSSRLWGMRGLGEGSRSGADAVCRCWSMDLWDTSGIGAGASQRDHLSTWTCISTVSVNYHSFDDDVQNDIVTHIFSYYLFEWVELPRCPLIWCKDL